MSYSQPSSSTSSPNPVPRFIHKPLSSAQLRSARIIDRKIIKNQLCYCFQLARGKQTWQPVLQLLENQTAERMIWLYEEEQKLLRRSTRNSSKNQEEEEELDPETIKHNQKILDQNEITRFIAYDQESERFVVQFADEDLIPMIITKAQFYKLPMEKQLMGYRVLLETRKIVK